MGSALSGNMVGVGVYDDRFTSDKIMPSTAATNESDFTQAGGMPGLGVATAENLQALIQLSGSQNVGVSTRFGIGGWGTRPYRVLLNDTTGDDVDYLGWRQPWWMETARPINFEASTGSAVRCSMATLPTSERPCILSSRFSENAQFSRLDSASWTTVDTGLAIDTNGAPRMVVLDSGRILAFNMQSGRARYSDDEGATWATMGDMAIDTISDVTGWGDEAAIGNTILAVTQKATAAGGNTKEIHQHYSTDGGSTWTAAGFRAELTAASNDEIVDVAVVALRTGQFGVFFARDDGAVDFQVVSNPALEMDWEHTSNIEITASGAASDARLAAFVDYDGRLWAWVNDQGGRWKMYVSEDAVTFKQPNVSFAAQIPDLGSRMIAWGNGVIWAAPIDNSTDTASGVVAHHMGGWGNLTPTKDTGASTVTNARSMGDKATEDAWTGTSYPDTLANLVLTGGASKAIGDVQGFVEIVGDGANTLGWGASNIYNLPGATTKSRIIYSFTVSVPVGGSQTDNRAALFLRWSDAATRMMRVYFRFNTTGFAINDVGAAADLSTHLADMTVPQTFIVSMAEDPPTGSTADEHKRIVVWRKALSEDRYTLVTADDTLTAQAKAGAGDFQMGHLTAASGTTMRLFDLGVGFTDDTNSLAWSVLSAKSGGPLSQWAYPVPSFSESGKYLYYRGAALGAAFGEGFDHPARYTYGVENICLGEHPSPGRVWRSTADNVAQSIVFEYTQPTKIEGSGYLLCFGLLNANFKSATLDGYNGVSWTTLVTLDLSQGFTSLKFDRSGSTVRADPTTLTDGARYLRAGELEGGHVVLDPAGTPVRRTITRQQSGFWSTETTKHPRLTLADTTGSEPSSGICDLVFRNGFGLFHGSGSGDSFSRYRLSIPSQGTPSGYYQLGGVFIGGIYGVGKMIDRGHTRQHKPNITNTVAADGAVNVTKLGEATDEWSVSWQDLTNKKRGVRQTSGADFWRAGGSGEPIAIDDDVYPALVEMADSSGGGEMPAVMFAPLMTDAVTVVDADRFLYGHLASTQHESHVVGNEMDDEVTRTAKITVVGQPKAP